MLGTDHDPSPSPTFHQTVESSRFSSPTQIVGFLSERTQPDSVHVWAHQARVQLGWVTARRTGLWVFELWAGHGRSGEAREGRSCGPDRLIVMPHFPPPDDLEQGPFGRDYHEAMS